MQNAFSIKEGTGIQPSLSVKMHSSSLGNNPSLHPAFRVRRGSFSKCAAMTRYDGSRASGYPPDLVPFSPTAGAARRLRPLRAHVIMTREAVLPSAFWGKASGKCPRSGGCTKGQAPQSRQGIAVLGGKQRRRARPSNKCNRSRNCPQLWFLTFLHFIAQRMTFVWSRMSCVAR